MATKEQYDAFRWLYEEEERRYSQLEARARLYLSVVALFLATLILKAEDVQKSAVVLGLSWLVVVIVAALFACALVLIVVGSMIRTYEGVADPEDIIQSLSAEPPSNEEFFDSRIVDFAVATNRNSRTNDRNAMALAVAAILIMVSMAVLLGNLAMSLRPHQ